MELNLNQKCEAQIEEGIAIDFVEGQWIVLVKDAMWTDYELKALRRNKLFIHFVESGAADLFLIQVEDALETSDCPFDVRAQDYSSCFRTFEKGDGYPFVIAYLNEENIIVAKREVKLNTQMSNCISSHLKAQSENGSGEASFESDLAKLQSRFQPFECEEFALAFNQF